MSFMQSQIQHVSEMKLQLSWMPLNHSSSSRLSALTWGPEEKDTNSAYGLKLSLCVDGNCPCMHTASPLLVYLLFTLHVPLNRDYICRFCYQTLLAGGRISSRKSKCHWGGVRGSTTSLAMQRGNVLLLPFARKCCVPTSNAIRILISWGKGCLA